MKPERALQQARQHLHAGDLDAARMLIRRVLKTRKNNADALFLAGYIDFHKGDYAQAAKAFERVLRSHPNDLGSHLNLGVALHELGDAEGALRHYRLVIDQQPVNHEAYYNAGNAYRSLNRLDEAKAAYLRCIELNPAFAPVYNNLGAVCNALRHTADAIRYLRRAIDLAPGAAPYVNLLSLLRRQRSPQAYDHALEVLNLAEPGPALLYAYIILAESCRWDVVDRIEPAVLDIARSEAPTVEMLQDLLLTLNQRPGIDPAVTLALHRRWGERVAVDVQPFTDFSDITCAQGRIRIGYLSPDFREHSVGLFIRNVIAAHDGGRFEVHCYHTAEGQDAMTASIRAQADGFVDVSGMEPGQIAAQVRRDGIHILVDLAGHTRDTGLMALAYRPAPVQMTYLGYPNTTGLAAVDYRITDSLAEHPRGTQYTEQLLKLPECFVCFGAFEDRPIESQPPARRRDYVTFASFNNVRKLTPAVIRAWSEILQRVPDSVLILKSGHNQRDVVRDNIVAEFSRHGIGAERLDLRGFVQAKSTHLDFYNQVDITLDPFPYNGTTTTCEALWMGVPVITLVGDRHAQRVSYSILKNIGIEDTIAHTEAEYVDKAVALALDLDVLEHLRTKLPGAVRASILCDPPRFTAQLEALYTGAWQQRGYELPATFARPHAPPAASKCQGDETLLSAAQAALVSGDLEGAQAHLETLLSEAPAHPAGTFLLGTLAYRCGDFARAVELLRAAVAADPDAVSAHLNLGAALTELGEHAQAVKCYERVLQLAPDHHLALNNLGNILKREGRLDEAQHLFERSIAADATDWTAQLNLGAVYASRRDYVQAVHWFRHALALAPEPRVYAALLSALHKQRAYAEAYATAIEVSELDEPGSALPLAWNTFANLCDWQRLQQVQAGTLAIAGTDQLELTVLQAVLLGLNGRDNLDAQTVFALHRQWGARVAAQCRPFGEHTAAYDRQGPLRIGYLSGDFCHHSVGYFIRSVIAAHDPQRVEVFCYSNTPRDDDLTEAIRQSSRAFVDVRELNDEALAARIHADGIQILIELGGHTSESRLAALVYRPAPVQVAYLGYPNTTGLDAVDYRISDPYADACGATLYTEQLLRLPESFLCFGGALERELESEPPVQRHGHVTFGSFNNLSKITPTVVAAWSEILRAVPGSRLMIKAEKAGLSAAQANIAAEFAKHGISPERLDLRGFAPAKETHLDLYNQIDIALDTFPYNGTTTTCEALWMGVPVVTWVGEAHAQRVSNSILTNIGVTETIAHSLSDYVECAVALASDRERLVTLRGAVATGLRRSILCDPARFTAQLEGALEQVWQRHLAGMRGGDRAHSPSLVATGGTVPEPVPGQWVEHVQNLPYAAALLPRWLSFLEARHAEAAWQAHQFALDHYAAAHAGAPNAEQHEQLLRRAYTQLLQLIDQCGTVANLLSFARIAAELGERDHAVAALEYVAGQFDAGAAPEIDEPFLPAAPRFDATDPGANPQAWVRAMVLDEIRALQAAVPVVAAPAAVDTAQRTPVRVLHNMARAGGTLIAKCLGCMQDITLLSEIHPLGTDRFNPLAQAAQWFDLFDAEESAALQAQGSMDFAAALGMIDERCRARGQNLVVRDWAHLDFTGVPFVDQLSYRLTTAEALRPRFDVIQAASTRHPIDQWLSLRRLGIIKGRLTLETFLHGYRRYAEAVAQLPYVRYEDFVAAPQQTMARLCDMLTVPYDPGFMDRWASYTTITGDVVSTRGGNTIQVVPRRPLEPGLLRQFADNPDYQAAISLLGYGHPY